MNGTYCREKWVREDGRQLEGFVYLPPGYQEAEGVVSAAERIGRMGTDGLPVLYVNEGESLEASFGEMMAEIEADFSSGLLSPFAIIAVPPGDFNDDYSPWPGKAVFKKAGDFGGSGEAQLRFLTSVVIPQTEEKYALILGEGQARRGIMGYSMAGLFSVYGAVLSGKFCRCISLSGSLWYDGFVEFMRGRGDLFAGRDLQFYLSLGDGEAKSRNPRMAQVADCTKEICELLQKRLGEDAVSFERNRGGHFSGIPGRFVKGMRWFGRSFT